MTDKEIKELAATANTRERKARLIARMVSEWEDSSELAGEFADRLLEALDGYYRPYVDEFKR